MCVAIYKPEGIKAPTLEILKDCWDANPDGAGLAWRCDGGKFPIHIEKGFMSWQEFQDYWNAAKIAEIDGDLFIHFRITTHGGTIPGNTHPFPISNDDKSLKTLSANTKIALMHNGVLPIEPDNKTISDTMMLSKLIARGGFDKEIKHTLNLIEGMIGTNKIAVMTADDVHLIGAWYDVDGVQYSNLYWDYSNYDYKWGCGKGTNCVSFDTRSKSIYEDYDDYDVLPTKDDIELLDAGLCPICGESDCVAMYKDYYLCDACGVSYRV
jgi:hypothetical protein